MMNVRFLHSRRAARNDGRRHVLVYGGLMTLLLASAGNGQAESFTLSTLAGDLQIPLIHVDVGGTVPTPASPGVPPFTAPTIFAAPLPSGSGARALGAAGAFTAIADDATAASWNPSGLTQLERPELSVAFRFKQEYDRHWSDNDDYQVGEDNYSGYALNYLSAVMPVRLWNRNAVVSLNLQEVFDFSHQFHADFSQQSSSRSQQTQHSTASALVQNHYDLDNGTLDVTEMLTTHQTTTLDQRLSSVTLGQLDFEQEGSVQALSPAIGLEITPKIAFGAAVNLYLTGLTDSEAIRSSTRARYSGTTESRGSVSDNRQTSGTWTYTGQYVSPTLELPFGPESGEVPTYSTTVTDQTVVRQNYEGYYDVYDSIDDFRGMNATFGALWHVESRLTLGGCLDLPWRANANQTKTVHSGLEVNGQTVARQSSRETKDISFDFPLYWAVGGAWRWTDRITSSLDLSQTLWSDYSYKAEGDRRSNPLDGSPYGEHPVDDCWAVRTGLEYLWVLAKTEIPFRAGLSCEQRPAVGSPDLYKGVSLGSGISLGQGAHKVIVDVAYLYTWGQDVMGTLVPGQTGTLGTDVDRHDLYVSCIYHF